MADFGDNLFESFVTKAFEVLIVNSTGDLDESLSSFIFFCWAICFDGEEMN